MDTVVVECPHCGSMRLDIHSFNNVIVMDRGFGLATYACPYCFTPLASFIEFDDNFATEVDSRIHRLTFDHPRSNLERFCISPDLRNESRYVELFKSEMSHIDSVDTLLKRINAAFE